jgi:hypothetical protein
MQVPHETMSHQWRMGHRFDPGGPPAAAGERAAASILKVEPAPLPFRRAMSSFGEGEGELLTLHYPKPLPMRLDRWLVAQRPEQSRARIQKFIEAGYVRVNGVTGRAKTPLR